jgi:nucleoside-diphosphate-sugar epimerase
LAVGLVAQGWIVDAAIRRNSITEASLRSLGCSEVYHHDGSTQNLVDIVQSSAPDVVFHLASLFIAEHKTAEVQPLIESNVLFGAQLLEAMATTSVTRIVNTGTAWQHYRSGSYRPVCLYAATKQAFEDLMGYYIDGCGLKAITLKLFDTYGPNDRRPKLFSALRRAATQGIPMEMSPGEQLLDLVYIDDVIRAFLKAGERLRANLVQSSERYAVTSGKPIRLRDLVEVYEKVTGCKIDARWGARKYRAREVMEPWAGGTLLPGWQPQVDLEDGIRRAEGIKLALPGRRL